MVRAGNGGMPLSTRPSCTTARILSPRTSRITRRERVRSGPDSPPAASRPWQKEQLRANSDLPRDGADTDVGLVSCADAEEATPTTIAQISNPVPILRLYKPTIG